jgi:UDP-GlcNAc:undecaprenyl-phosphate/decaprenyl-phosphate GlcNAc-1-phosphate transferase
MRFLIDTSNATHIAAAISLLATAASSIIFCRLLIRFSDRLPFRKEPRPERWHRKTTPDSGGIAIGAAAVVGWMIALPGRYPAVAVGAALFWVLGLIDDRLGFTARWKLLAQLVIASGVASAGLSFNVVQWWPVNFAFTVFWLVGITNAINLIDNMDGLAAGVAIIIAVFRAALLSLHGNADEALLCGILAAATAGFLVLNCHPAKIFMGDSGSMFIGFSLAALTVPGPLLHTRSVAVDLFYPVLTFSYPIFDTTLVCFLRLAAGRPIYVGNRDHSSHRLASLGLSERTIVMSLWTSALVGAMLGLLLRDLPLAAGALLALLGVFASLFGLFLATLPAPSLPGGPIGQLREVPACLRSLCARIAFLIDATFAGIAVSCAFLLRFNLALPPIQLHHLAVSIPVAAGVHAVASILNRIHRASWNHFDGSQAVAVLRASAISAVLVCGGLVFLLPEYPRSIAIMYFILVAGIELSTRASLRIMRSLLVRAEGMGRRVAVFGADADGEALVRYLRGSTRMLVVPVVFLDDRSDRLGVRFAGLPVRCASGSIQALRNEFRIDAIVIPAERSSHEQPLGVRERIHEAGLDLCPVDIFVRPMNAAASTKS